MESIRRLSKEDYAKLERHTEAHIAKWATREIAPPPHRCGNCGTFTEGATRQEFERNLWEHVHGHAPA